MSSSSDFQLGRILGRLAAVAGRTLSRVQASVNGQRGSRIATSKFVSALWVEVLPGVLSYMKSRE